MTLVFFLHCKLRFSTLRDIGLIGCRFPFQALPLNFIQPESEAFKFICTHQPIPVLIKKFSSKYEPSQEIFNPLLHEMVKSGFHTSFFKSKNEVKKILSVPENKLNQFNVINSSEIMHVIEELQNFMKFVTGDDMKKLIQLTSEAVKREFCVESRLIKRLWDFIKGCKDFNFTDEYLIDFLSMCPRSKHNINLEDVLQLMEDYDIKLSQDLSQLIIGNLCRQGDREATEAVLGLMKAQNLQLTENIYSSLIILSGKEGNNRNVHNRRLEMIAAHVTPSLLTKSALVMAYNLCKAYEDAREVLETVKISDAKFTSDQYCDIVSSCVMSDIERGREYSEHLQYILESKMSVAEDTDLRNVILELIHTDFAAEAIHILSTHEHYKRKPHLNKSGAIFIRELVRAKCKDPATVVKLCGEIVRVNINTNAFQVALEAALFENHNDVAWSVLKTLKGRGAPLKEHYFWPLFVSKDDDEDPVAKQVSVLAGMGELGVKPGFETLHKFVIPNLPFETPEVAFQILSKGGVSRSKAMTPLIATLISNLMMDLAIQLAKESNILIFGEYLMEPLAIAYLQNSQKTLNTLNAILQQIKKTPTFQAEPITKGFGLQFIDSVINVSRVDLSEEEVTGLIEKLERIGIDCSEPPPQDSLPETENDREPTTLKQTKHEHKNTAPHPHEKVSVMELERHFVELKQKSMNTRGVLRRLLIKYSAAKDEENCSRILEEMKMVEGTLSPGMLSSALCSNVLASDANEGLKMFWLIHDQFPTFLINSFAVVDLCSLLVRCRRSKEAMSLMQKYVEKTPRDFHHKKAILKNCNRLLMECVTVEGYDFAREMCSLLLKEGLADANPIILGPLIKAILDRDDIVGVVEEAETLYSTYGVLPMRIEILIKLMKASMKKSALVADNESSEDASAGDLLLLIERILTLIRKSRGPRQVNEDILTASLEIGDEAEVARVFKHVENNLKIDRIRQLCNHFVRHKKANSLLLLLAVSKSSSYVDRVYICECLINIYTVQRDSKAALDLWQWIQLDEEFRVQDSFIQKLNRLLKATGANPSP